MSRFTDQGRAKGAAVKISKTVRDLMNAVSDAIYIHDFHGLILEVNNAACQALGYSADELKALPVWEIEVGVPKEHIAQLAKDLHKGPVNLEGRHKRKDGSIFPVDVRLGLFNTGGKKLVLAVVRDITQKKGYEEMLKHQATYDNLTNLPNRVFGVSKLVHAISRANTNNLKLAVLFMDLDDFKLINDSMGHAAGDLLLKALSERYLSVIRQTDTIARLGGDEFMLIIENLSHLSDAEQIAKKCQEVCRRPFNIESKEITVSSSIGIAIYPDHGSDAKSLMRKADTAMYKSKLQGKNSWAVYANSMAELATNRVRIQSEILQALTRDELFLCYQPIIDLKENKVVAAEALLRWDSASLGLILPDQMIPIAEEMGLIVPLGYWILERVCEQVKEWHKVTGRDIKVAVNISTLQLMQKDFVRKLKAILKKAKVAPELIILEITESAFIDDSKLILSQLKKLSALNIHCSLDDFGMGYSSLSYVRSYPFKSLKIDRVFIHSLNTNSRDLSLVHSIIAMSRNLKLTVIAEGIETAEQLELIRSMNCDLVQGWYFSKALTSDEFLTYLKKAL